MEYLHVTAFSTLYISTLLIFLLLVELAGSTTLQYSENLNEFVFAVFLNTISCLLRMIPYISSL